LKNKFLLVIGIYLFATGILYAQKFTPKTIEAANLPFFEPESKWVDSVFQTLTPDERIGQLFMIAAYSNRNKTYEDSLSQIVSKYKLGGLIFFQGGPVRQAKLTNRYQGESKVPLMISIDGEWGLGMRLDSVAKFPYQMTLGAIQDDNLIYQMGAEIGKHCKRMGIHVNFAPVVDINNNPQNPVINFRSFGEDKYNVTAKSYAYMRGMQDNYILANAKHFPGHGDTDTDSHYALPIISHNRTRLDSLEMYPFQELFKGGMGSVMVAHLNIPALDPSKNLASTLSAPIVTDLLKNQMQFKGLVFTDALNMKGVADFFPPGVVDVKALLAGNDVLLFSKDVGRAIQEIKLAIKQGKITQKEIDDKCRKILAAKEWAGLNNYKPIELKNLVEDLNTPQFHLLINQLTEASLTVLRNRNEVLPIKDLDKLKIASLSINTELTTGFQDKLALYASMDHYTIHNKATQADNEQTLEALKNYNLVIVGVHDLSQRAAAGFGLSAANIDLLQKLAASGNAIITFFGNPYGLAKIDGIQNTEGLIVTYQENKSANDMAAQLIFGGVGASGKLPVNVSQHFKMKDGLKTEGGIRFKYTFPEEVSINSKILERKIDAIANEAIDEGAAPGCQVLIVKEGKVIFQKSYGHHTYDKVIPVANDHIYDLASITKISASLPALMMLDDQGKFHPDDQLKDHLWKYRIFNNKRNLTFRNILTHRSGLKAWIPFWKNTVDPKTGVYKRNIYSFTASDEFPYEITDKLYLNKKYQNKIYKSIRTSPVSSKKEYVYSDLSYYLYPLIVKNQTGEEFDQFLSKNFYSRLGANTLGFNAYKKWPRNKIVPTEYDSLFRRGLLHGHVHDEGAAMLNGISGHAGLFGNANDLAKLMQMYLNGGSYGGERFIQENTIKEYSRCQFCEEGNRRGIGFDKPMIDNNENGNTAVRASKATFGHTGFTGTCTWVDPEEELVYVFLSNRVYPTRENLKLSKLNIRTRIQQAIYEAIDEGKRLSISEAVEEK
jgi:beta-N-acetylhexosaminidase